MADKIAVPDRDGRLARNEKLEKQIQGGQERRREALAKLPTQTTNQQRPKMPR